MWYNNYLYSIYVVTGIVSNLEMISSAWEDMSRFCTNTPSFYIRDLSIEEGFLEPVPGTVGQLW